MLVYIALPLLRDLLCSLKRSSMLALAEGRHPLGGTFYARAQPAPSFSSDDGDLGDLLCSLKRSPMLALYWPCGYWAGPSMLHKRPSMLVYIKRTRASDRARANKSQPPSDHLNVENVENVGNVHVGHVGHMVINSTITGDAYQRSEIQGTGTEDAVEPPSDTEPDETLTLEAAFQSSFAGFNRGKKWILTCSERAVEDVLYAAYEANCGECDDSFPDSLVRDWTIDLGNDMMKKWFTDKEWEEICSSVPPLPEPNAEFARSLARFHNVQTTADLRRVLETVPYRPVGTPYDRALHFDSEWADNVLRAFLVLFESGQLLRKDHLEGWYSIHVWSLLDDCFLSFDDISIQRVEATCRATAIRKNRERTDTRMRMKSGPRLDGIIRSVEDDSHEYGGMEVARTLDGGTSSTKWLRDTQKLVRALRDMLDRLHQIVEHEPTLVKKLQVVGFITAGRALMMLRLCHPKGYICVLKNERLLEVPSKVPQLKQLLLLLASVVQMKGVVARSVDAVRCRSQAQSETALLEEIMSGGARNEATLPRSADSP
ncbi:hypothetical protein FN846DRAFT_923174 [Sphaerosporella brunnea]|uniref:Uncharacterized protein n=1 Tax=Sphaerosporella brunnea TaxID=1250544 RepID=A0A5J5EFX0_9PEZI|nr:hypothetical protein FN846DRAFT_923174 [Sphaerosporella brunnea]